MDEHASIFVGDSEVARLLRAKDWSRSPLGPPSTWPQSLRTVIRLMLTSRYQMWLGWGDELLFFYNDAYTPTLGVKHPAALGTPTAVLWAEIWDDIKSRIEAALSGRATWDEGFLLYLERNGYAEETYHTFSYSPVHDDDGRVGGMLCVVVEESERVVDQRRSALLGALAANLTTTTTTEQVFATVAALHGPAGVPGSHVDAPRLMSFALAWLFDDAVDADGRPRGATLMAHGGVDDSLPGVARRMELADGGDDPWQVRQLLADGQPRRVTLPTASANSTHATAWPRAGWLHAPHEAMVLPIARPGQSTPAGALVVALSPHRPFDEGYDRFLRLYVGEIAAALGNVRAWEEQKRSAEALAALDRAKTVFFSNVSHELRTPLTLLLGPLQDALARDPPVLAGDDLDVAHRSAQRLLKLVNTLLEFSRIEAGRVVATYRPTDLPALTKDLASAFRSAIERAGLAFDVDASALSAPVFVDHDMWEKIVLNLLSNALKFTFSGRIAIAVRERGDDVVLVVGDTGTGIAAAELPRLFERFHRVEGARSRSIEGSGIGLALVADLVRLHGGRIEVDSVVGRGTTFTVTIPRGHAHLDAARVDATAGAVAATGAALYVDEALGWLPEKTATLSLAALSSSSSSSTPSSSSTSTPSQPPASSVEGAPLDGGVHRDRLLVADDNADMRGYLRRLLADRWEVEVVKDGAEALDAARAKKPDLVLSDVMMPRLDGFGLLAALRADDALKDVPVMLLSARAGEDARIEGLDAGADDYVVKPFTAKELVARVRARLEVSRLQRVVLAERKRLTDVFMAAPAAIVMLSGPDHVFELVNARYQRDLIGGRDVIGMTARAALPEVEGQGFFELLDGVYRDGKAVSLRGARVVLHNPDPDERYLDFVYQPRRDVDGNVDGVLAFIFDVTSQIQAQKKLEQESRSKDEFLAMLAHELRNPLAPVMTAVHLARAQPEITPKLDRHLTMIERQAQNLSRIVDDLLDVSRITRGLVTLKRQVVDVAAIARAAVDTVAALVESKQHELKIIVPHKPVLVSADPVRLEQVLVNLLTNAAKYTDRGGQLTLEVERLRTSLPSSSSSSSSSSSLGEVIVRVTDSGVGIDAAMLPRVFDLFQQAERSLDRSLGGLGIGLTIVRRLVEMHGGSISARSGGRGQGSTFELRLPLVEAERVDSSGVPRAITPAPALKTPPTTTPTPTTLQRPLSVLIVDDNIDAAEALRELVESWGHDARVAADGPSALVLADAEAPDVAILDIGLPGMDGYEIAAALRSRPSTKSALLLALTGYGQPDDRTRALAAGFDGHLTKPVPPSEIAARLATAPRLPRG